MSQNYICSYCYRNLLKLNSASYLKCTCQLCTNCIAYLKSHSISSCPLCGADISNNEASNSTTQPLPTYKTVQNHNKSLRPAPLTPTDIKSFSSNLRSYSKSLEIQKNSLKTLSSLKNTNFILGSEHSIHISSDNSKKLLNFIKEMNLFQYNQKYSLILFNSFLTSSRIEIQKLSRMALEIEKKELKDLEHCLFLGRIVAFKVIKQGIVAHKFKIFTKEPCELLEIGIGRSVGLNSSLFIFNFCILEDNQIIYKEDIMMEVHNSDSRLTAGIRLNKPVSLKDEKVYKLRYCVNADFQYIFRYSKKIIEKSSIKIQHVKYHGLGCITFYLKFRNCFNDTIVSDKII